MCKTMSRGSAFFVHINIYVFLGVHAYIRICEMFTLYKAILYLLSLFLYIYIL